jgi:O-antigen/teichoic acid export membrane protein
MAAAVGAQVALGLLLSKEDFGVYGIAMGISAFAMVIRDAGVRLYLVQLTPDRVAWEVPRALRLTHAWSLAIGLTLALASFPLSAAFRVPRMAPVILVLAATLPLSAYPSVALALVQVQMRFRALAAISLVAALLRYGSMVTFAALGFGALSLALPAVAVGFFELLAARFVSRVPISALFRSREGRSLRDWFAITKWTMAGSLVMQLGLQADYVALGLVAATATVGVYYFGYQVAVQLSTLTSGVIPKVLIPALAQTRGDPPRAESVFQRATAAAIAALGPLAAWLAVAAGDIEAFLWHGRWSQAVIPIRIIASTIPFQITLAMSDWLLQAWGSFTLWTLLTLSRGAGLFIVAFVAGVFFPTNASMIALCTGAYLLTASITTVAISVRATGFSLTRLARAVATPLLGAGASALGAAVVVLSRAIAAPLPSLAVSGLTSATITGAFYLLFWREGLRSIRALVTRRLPAGQ